MPRIPLPVCRATCRSKNMFSQFAHDIFPTMIHEQVEPFGTRPLQTISNKDIVRI